MEDRGCLSKGVRDKRNTVRGLGLMGSIIKRRYRVVQMLATFVLKSYIIRL